MTELEFAPYTKQRMAVREKFDVVQGAAKPDRSLWRLEKYVGSNGEERELHRINSAEGQLLNAEVERIYGINPQSDFDVKAIGKMLPGNVITTRAPEGYFLSPDGLVFASIKFYTDDGSACIKGYKLYLGDELPVLPDSVEVLGVADYTPMGKLPFPDELVGCRDVFFLGNHKTVCSFFGADLPEGKYMTGYGVRFCEGVIHKVKSYVYDDPTPQSQWRGITQLHRMAYEGPL